MNFSLNQIRYFLALAQEKHFGKAASRSFISQPTLSSAIKKLEHQLDVQLFERGHRQEVKLTDAGLALIPQAQQLLDQAENFQRLSQSQTSALQQPFRLGVIYSVAPYLLPGFIPQAKKQAPDMPLLIEENYTHNLRTLLLNGDLDAAIIALPFHEPGIETYTLYEEAFCGIVPANHHLASRKRIKRSDLDAEELLLLGPGHCFREQVIAACPQCVYENDMKEMFQGGSLETIVQMVASGAGVSILPERCAQQHEHNPLLKILKIENPKPYRQIALSWRSSSPKKEAIELIKTFKF